MTGLAEWPSRKPLETRKAALPPPTEISRVTAVLPDWRADLAARHAAERRQLISTQAAARRGCAGDDAAARAHAEILQAFAHRWAHIRRMPLAERAAAAAALHAEQAAALSVRTRELTQQFRHRHGAEQMERRHLFAAERKMLSTRHRAAWAGTAASIKACRPPRPPMRKLNTPAP